MTVEDLIELLADASRACYLEWDTIGPRVEHELNKLIQELDGAVAVWMVDGEGAWKIIAMEE